MGEPDRIARAWLSLITVFLVFQTPLMSHKLAMACGSALEALKGARQSRIEIQGLRDQLRANQSDQQRDPIVLETTFPISGPR
jgi:hypothetical protein